MYPGHVYAHKLVQPVNGQIHNHAIKTHSKLLFIKGKYHYKCTDIK